MSCRNTITRAYESSSAIQFMLSTVFETQALLEKIYPLGNGGSAEKEPRLI